MPIRLPEIRVLLGGSGSTPNDNVAESAAPQVIHDHAIIPDPVDEALKTTKVDGGRVPKKRKINAVKPPKGNEPMVKKSCL